MCFAFSSSSSLSLSISDLWVPFSFDVLTSALRCHFIGFTRVRAFVGRGVDHAARPPQRMGGWWVPRNRSRRDSCDTSAEVHMMSRMSSPQRVIRRRVLRVGKAGVPAVVRARRRPGARSAGHSCVRRCGVGLVPTGRGGAGSKQLGPPGRAPARRARALATGPSTPRRARSGRGPGSEGLPGAPRALHQRATRGRPQGNEPLGRERIPRET
jgi:hypothetical protein